MAATRSTTIATLHTSASVSDRPSPTRVVSAAAVAFSPPRYHAQLGRLRAWSSAAAASVGGFSSSAPFFLGAFADSIMLLRMVRVRISSSSSSSLRFRGLGLQAMVAESRSVQQGSSNGSSSSTSVMMTELLPKKLQEIVKMFEGVPDPRSKYEQLLHYAKQLKPLGKEYLTPENKVQGCVSQVWVRPSVKEDKRFYFEAESDSLLTKGLAALLVEGLSGSTAQEILAVTPDFIQALGLNQSLTPSRSNGFLNMLKLMQKKTLQLYMESEATSSVLSNSVIPVQTSSSSDSSKDTKTDLHKMLESSPPVFEKNSTMSSGGVVTTKKAVIEEKLEEALTPTELEVEDVSYQHAGHSGVERGATETHFNVKVVSESFEGRSLLKRHRLVYDVLKDELQTGGVHALSLITKTPREVSAAGKT
jgi:sulfur transfer protein SufE/stress-induced morphogen